MMEHMKKQEFAELVTKHQPYFYKIAYRYVKNEQDALDIVSEATCRGLTHIDDLRETAYFKTWMTRIVMNTALEHLRKNSRQVFLADSVMEHPAPPETEQESSLDLYTALDTLSDEEKSFIMLKYFKDYSFREIAALRKLPESTVKSKIYRCLTKMRLYLAVLLFFLLLCLANIPALYSFAGEIPILRTFVQALRIGHGGEEINDVTAKISADKHSVTISFLSDGILTDHVPSYSAAYYDAPSRLKMTFQHMDEDLFSELKETLIKLNAVADVYPVMPPQEDAFSFVIVLKGIYNYELMEFSNPGSLTLRFYQDAYYTEDERPPAKATEAPTD